MWNLNSIAKNLQEQVEKVARESGINERLAHAQARLGTFSDDILDVKPATHKDEQLAYIPSAQPEAAVNLQDGEADGQEELNGWNQGLDNVDFSGSEPQSLAFPETSKEQAPALQGHSSFKEENEILRSELQRYKLAAIDALGELEEAKERLLKAEDHAEMLQQLVDEQQSARQQAQSKLGDAEARMANLEELRLHANEQVEQLLESQKSAAERHQKEVEKLEAQLQKLQATASQGRENLQTPESSATSVSVPASPEVSSASPVPQPDPIAEVKEAKLKLQRAKRTLDIMKKREADAIAAKEAAQSELAALRRQLEEASEAGLKRKLHDLEAQNTRLLEDNEAVVTSMKEQNASLEQQLAEQTLNVQNLERLTEDQKKATRELEDVKAHLAEKEAEADALHNDLRIIKEKLQESVGLQQTAAEADGKQQELQAAHSMIQTLQADHSALLTRCDELSEGQRDREAVLKAANAERDELREQVLRLEDRVRGQSEALAEAQASCDSLRRDIEIRDQQGNESAAESAAKMAELEHCLECAEQRCRRMVSQLQATVEERDRAVGQVVLLKEHHATAEPVEQVGDDMDHRDDSHHQLLPIRSPTETHESDLLENPLFSPESTMRPGTPPPGGNEGTLVALRLELEATKNDLAEQMALVSELRSQLADLEGVSQSLTEAETCQVQLKEQMLTQQRQLEESQRSADQLGQALEKAELKASGASENQDEREASMLALEGRLKEALTELEGLRVKVASALADKQEKEQQLSDLESQLEASRRELQSLNEQLLGKSKGTSEQLGQGSSPVKGEGEVSQNESLRLELEQSRRQHLHAAEDLATAERRASELEDHLAATQRQLKAEQEACSTAATRLEECEKDLAAERAQIASLEQRLQDLSSEKEALQDQLEELSAAKDAAESASSKQQADVKALEDRCCNLEGQIRDLRRAQEENAGSKEGLQAMLTEKLEEVDRLQEQLSLRENALQAVREGSKAETNMAAAARREAEFRHQAAEDTVSQLRAELSQAEDRIEAALKDSRRKQDAAQKRCEVLEGHIAAAEEREQALQEQLAELHRVVEAERDAAEVQARSVTAQRAKELEKAVAEVRDAAESKAAEALDSLRAAIAAKNGKVQEQERQLEQLQSELATKGREFATLAARSEELASLQQNLKSLEAERDDLAARLDQAQNAARDAEKAAAERQKRFSLLNSQFKKREAQMQQAVTEAQSQATSLKEDLAKGKLEAKTTAEELATLRGLYEEAKENISKALRDIEKAEERVQAAEAEVAAATAESVSLQAALDVAVSRQSEGTSLSRGEIDDRISAAVEEASAEAGQRLVEAEEAVEAAKREVAEADARATAAEMAKIQLSMQLAELDDRPSARAGPHSPLGATEEEQFANSIMARRVATAEQEAEDLRRQLQAAEASIQRLEFQVRMVAEPQQYGGVQSREAGNAGSSVLDLFGCGANYRR